jgi:RimJ/RimL family protein N-acetyltransferase
MNSAPTIDFSTKPVLTGRLVTLRPVTVADVPVLHSAMSDAEAAKLTGLVHSLAEVGEERWSKTELEEIYGSWTEASDRIVWAIVDNSSGTVVGESVLNDLDIANRSCGFRIWIAGARDRGLGTEATRLTVQHAFEDQQLNRVELEVYDFNPRARHVYEKVGFVHEGTKRQALRFENDWVDAHDMSILACEWVEHRGHAVP